MKEMIAKILEYIFRKPLATKTRNFFDYSAREKKKIIVAASREAAKKQEDIIRRYNRMFPSI